MAHVIAVGMMQRDRSATHAAKFLLTGGLAFYFCYVLRAQVLVIFAAVMFAVIFNPVVGWVRGLRIGRWSPGKGAAILILLALVAAVITVVVAFAAPKIAGDMSGLADTAPQIVAEMQSKISGLPFGQAIAKHLHGDFVQRSLQAIAGSAFAVFKSASSGILALGELAILTAYLILESEKVLRWTISLFPAGEQERLRGTLLRGGERVQRWLRGQLLLMLILGSSSAVVFGLLHIRFFYAIAVFAGLANFVPVLGPIATLLLAGVVAAADSWGKLLGVIIFYAVYQQVENSYLTPRIMRATVGLPATAVITALVIGAGLAGVLGAMLAVPTAALAATLIDEYWIGRHKAGENVATRVVKSA